VSRAVVAALALAALGSHPAAALASLSVPLSAILSGSQVVSRTLDTAIGRTIQLQGRLALGASALAGREVPGAVYHPEATAQVEASNSAFFRLIGPSHVRLDAESGQDYAAVPEPAQGTLACVGGLALRALRRRRTRA
jgi:hypothetical protein